MCSMEIKASNCKSGDALLRLTPRLRYGPQTYVAQSWQRAFDVDVTRQETGLQTLETELPLRLGQTLVITNSCDSTDLGDLFFGLPFEPDDQRRMQTRRLLIIRLLQTQSDDLFGASR